jgi:hypothetical protein
MSAVRIFRRTGLVLSSALVLIGGAAGTASAAAPSVGDTWATGVTASVAVFYAEVNPNGEPTTYHFEYISDADYQANVEAAKDPFTGALRYPVAVEANIGVSNTFEEAVQHAGGMKAETAYLYRIATKNASGTTYGETKRIVTQASISTFELPDRRGWEMVSPIDKNGGEIQSFNGVFGGGVLQGASGGGMVTYSSTSSFGDDAPGAPGASQYLGTRTSSGWVTQNITLPMVAGGYSNDGAPYQLFSQDLAGGLVINGDHCRTTGTDCPVPNPPLAGSGAPAGYLNYYLRDNLTGAYHALLTASEIAFTDVAPENFDVIFAGATPDLGQVAVSSCAALTADATEALVGGDACDPTKQNLYLWSPTGLRLINVLPGDSQGTPGARLAAQDAISDDGSRAYWMDNAGGGLYLNQAGAGSTLVSAAGVFQTASSNGGFAFFTQGGHLYRYLAPSGPATDLTPGGGVLGVLGASDDGGVVYYLDGTGVHRWDGSTSSVAAGAHAGNYPPTTGTARVSADGSRLLFLSDEDLTGVDSFGAIQLFIYSEPGTGGTSGLVCVSCNPSGERPQGDSSIPGAIANGEFAGATQLYKPRVLSGDGNHVFFESADGLLPKDTNGESDVFEWEAFGSSGCGLEAGCILPISSGRGKEGASFVDASLDGTDAFFLTNESLFGPDPGGVDIYDARVIGGFPEPAPPLACIGDACQALPPKPEDPEPGTGFLTDELNGGVQIKTLHRRHRRHRKQHAKKPHRKHRGKGKSRGGRR